METLSNRLLLTTQVALAAGVLGGIALYPPAEGRILLVPIVQRDANAVARLALAAEARPLGAGPLTGSLVVVGRRDRLSSRIAWWRVVMLAAPPAGCGAADDTRTVTA